MFKAMTVSGTGLQAQRVRMDAIAENIANAEATRTPEGGPFQRLQVIMRSGEGLGGGVEVQGVVRDLSPAEIIFDPSHPDANADGYVEMPNVDVPTEMVDMVAASRAYEANAKALAMARDMVRDSIDIMS